MRSRQLALLAACATALGGCSVGPPSGPASRDKRGETLECLTDEKGIPAQLAGDDSIQLEAGPRIRFFLTGGEAEATQFKGRVEGAYQIGAALLFTRGSTDDELLREVEDCLESF